MPKFGRTSSKRLATCHEDLQDILNEAIQYVDFSIVQGHRSVEKQLEYFKRGREIIGDNWIVVDRDAVITNIDGVTKKGKHNHSPSLAVDIVPYYKGKHDWKDRQRYRNIVYFIKGIAFQMGFELRLGCDWDSDFENRDHSFKDLPHMELYRHLNERGEWVKYE